MSAILVAELRKEGEALLEHSRLARGTANRANARRRGNLLNAAAAVIELGDANHRKHVEDDGRCYECTVCLAEQELADRA